MATPRRDKDAPAKADPRRGRNPGYAEDQPRDRSDARQAATPAQASAEERRGGRSDIDSAKGKR